MRRSFTFAWPRLYLRCSLAVYAVLCDIKSLVTHGHAEAAGAAAAMSASAGTVIAQCVVSDWQLRDVFAAVAWKTIHGTLSVCLSSHELFVGYMFARKIYRLYMFVVTYG